MGLTDHDLRVRAIRRYSRIVPILGKMVLHDAGCSWTKAGRSARDRFNRLYPRIRNDYQMVVPGLNAFQLLTVAYESAAEAHVVGCRCRRCPRTPKLRRPSP